MKGYLTPWGYMGLIDGKYMAFESEGAYQEYFNERSDIYGEHRDSE